MNEKFRKLVIYEVTLQHRLVFQDCKIIYISLDKKSIFNRTFELKDLKLLYVILLKHVFFMEDHKSGKAE